MILVLHPEWRAGVDFVRTVLLEAYVEVNPGALPPELQERQAREEGDVSWCPVVMVYLGVNCVAVLFEPVQQRAKWWMLNTEKKMEAGIMFPLLQNMDRVSGEESTRIEDMNDGMMN